MSHLRAQSPALKVEPVFAAVAAKPARRRAKSPPPFSLRLSRDERERLEAAAGGTPLGAYIRSRLFDGNLPARPKRRAPVKDYAALAQVLGMLGNLRLASNLNQLAMSANMGTLPLSPEVEQELITACAAVLAIKAELMRSLGYPPEKGE